MNPPSIAAFILAGGASRRFGSPKALASVGVRQIVERVQAALAEAGLAVRLITGEPARYAHLELPSRPDVHPGVGALGGIHTALCWAVEVGSPGALCVACDMPFIPPGVFRRITDEASHCLEDLVAPGSPRTAGIEPLCAFYRSTCLGPIEAMIAEGERKISNLCERVSCRRIAPASFREYGEPETLFMNVNTPGDRERANGILLQSRAPHDA